MMFLVGGVLHIGFLVGFFFAPTYTIIGHSDTFANLGGVILVICKVVFRQPFTKLEVLGVFIAVIGCTLILLDPKAAKADASVGADNILFGDMLAFTSSVSTVLYFTLIEYI